MEISRAKFWTFSLDSTGLLNAIAGDRLLNIETDLAWWPGLGGVTDGDILVFRTATGVGWEAPSAGGGADSALLVSMDRDDVVRGEKEFAGEISVYQRILHIGTTTAGTPGSMNPIEPGFFLQTDTSTMKPTPYSFLVQQTGAGVVWGIHETGIIDFVRQSAFRGYRSTNQAITTAASQLSCNAETFDQQSEHNTAGSNPYKFTATEAGKYHIYSRATVITAVASTVYMMIYKNGIQNTLGATVRSIAVPYLGFAAYPEVENEISLAAGDYLEIYVQSTVSGYMYGATDETFFIVRKVL